MEQSDGRGKKSPGWFATATLVFVGVLLGSYVAALCPFFPNLRIDSGISMDHGVGVVFVLTLPLILAAVLTIRRKRMTLIGAVLLGWALAIVSIIIVSGFVLNSSGND